MCFQCSKYVVCVKIEYLVFWWDCAVICSYDNFFFVYVCVCVDVDAVGLGPRHYTVHLRAVLLLQFMEHLDKLMFNAYEGSCVTLPMVPKVRGTYM